MERIERAGTPLILRHGTQTMDFVFTEIRSRHLLGCHQPAQPLRSSTSLGERIQALTELAHTSGWGWTHGQQPPLEYGPPRVTRNRGLSSSSAAEKRLGCGQRSAGISLGTARFMWRAQRLDRSGPHAHPVMHPGSVPRTAAAAARGHTSGWVSQGPRFAEFDEACAGGSGRGTPSRSPRAPQRYIWPFW